MSTGGAEFTRPWGERLRSWRQSIPWSQEELVEQIVAQAYRAKEDRGTELGVRLLRKWESGAIGSPQAVYLRLLAQLGAPLPMPAPEERGSDLILPSSVGAGSSNDEHVERRDFLQLGSATALGATGIGGLGDALQRLERALAGGTKPDETLVAGLEQHTLALFDAEEHRPSSAVIQDTLSHLDNITGLLGQAEGERLTQRLTAQAGTAAALAGWLAFDLGDYDTAQRYYCTASDVASRANESLLLACVYTYRSYLSEARGRGRESEQWLSQAQPLLPRGQQATMHSWIAARQAEIAIALGEPDSALRALDRAYLVQEFAPADPDPAPPWTGFFTGNRLDGMAVAGYARANHPDEMDTVAQRMLGEIGSGETKVQQIALADLAYSYLERGEVERGAQLAQRALTAISESRTRVGYERLNVVTHALTPYRGSRTVADLEYQLNHLHRS